MLFINYKGANPQQRFYNIGVKGNGNSNKIVFVVEAQQSDIVLTSLACNLKVESTDHKYLDLIMLEGEYDLNTDTISFEWLMPLKSTQYRNLQLQLEFIDGEDVVWQTLIAELELNETIRVGEEVSDKELSVLKQMEVKVNNAVQKDDIADDLDTEDSEMVLSAKQGKVLKDMIENIDVENMVEITYAELKALRDNAELKAGKFYRITDYETTTSTSNTNVAQHYFDVIVLAVSNDTLNENAWACNSARDTDDYFSQDNPNGWEIKYCLDNDTTRFAWANTNNGKGVIFYMKDNYGNECPYDFKNMLFTANDWNNVYTFCSIASGVQEMSRSQVRGGCRNNIIKPKHNGIQIQLNFILFVGNENYFETYNNIFEEDCANNYFYGRNQNIRFGRYCYNNTIGKSSNNISFANFCYNNTIGYSSSNIVFKGGASVRNTIGNYSTKITFGESSHDNTIGSSCSMIDFETGCQANNIGDNCDRISLEHSCKNIILGENCHAIAFGNTCWNINANIQHFWYSAFECGVSYLDITANGTGSNQNRARYFTFHKGCGGTSSTHKSIVFTRNNAFSTDYWANNSINLNI